MDIGWSASWDGRTIHRREVDDDADDAEHQRRAQRVPCFRFGLFHFVYVFVFSRENQPKTDSAIMALELSRDS